jgi:two-component system, chemotaxis family, chemotaxis protein CheY
MVAVALFVPEFWAVFSSAAERNVFGQIKVLIVDDEYQVRKVVHGLLLAIGCTKIHEARDGAEALESTGLLSPDVVLLDWTLSDMSGPEFLRRIRAGGAAQMANVSVVIMAGQGERACVLEAVRLGVHEFLLKPVSITALQERLASVLGKSLTLQRGDEPRRHARKLAS